jgi:hypothetical protein
MQMFTTQSTTDRIDNNSFVTSNGATSMLTKSISTNNRIMTMAAIIVVAVIALFSSAIPASADNDSDAGAVPLAEFRALTIDAPWAGSLEEAGQGHASVINMAAFYADTVDAPSITSVSDDGQVSRVIAMFTPRSTNAIDLSSFNALVTDAPYAASLEEVGQGGPRFIDLPSFYADTTDAPHVG